MRKIMGIFVVSAVLGMCMVGCEMPPSAKPVAPGTPAAGVPIKATASGKADAASSPVPTVNPNYNGGGLGSKAK